MTKEQAIVLANRFYSLYLQKARKTSVRNPVVGARIYPDALSREAHWIILREDRAEIRIQDKTGLPERLFLPAHHSESAVGNPRSGADLETQARKYRELFSNLGQFTEPPQVIPSLRVHSNEVLRSFDWVRTDKSVPFYRQRLRISVNSSSGELIEADLNGWGALPTNDIATLTKSKAQEIALLRVRQEFPKATLQLAKSLRQIVERNTYWVDGNLQILPESRFVWLIVIGIAKGEWALVGVDSQTGEIVYGNTLTQRG